MKINSTLRPGLLVTLRTSVRGNAMYSRFDVESPHVISNGAMKSKWETEKIIEDPAEYTEATRIRSKAANRVRNVCIQSLNGLLCPTVDQAKLEEAITDARDFIDDFNSKAKITKVALYVIVGRIAGDDAEAVRAVNEEVRTLIEQMDQGLRSFDVKSIRAAAEQARQVGRLLPEASSKKLTEAIASARQAATKIARAGDAAQIEIDEQVFAQMRGARLSFLDLEEAPENDDINDVVRSPVRAVDLTPEQV